MGGISFKPLKFYSANYRVNRKAQPDSGVKLVDLPDGLMYMMRPVIQGMCKYESLIDGSLDLADVALMNAALQVDAENQLRLAEAAQK